MTPSDVLLEAAQTAETSSGKTVESAIAVVIPCYRVKTQILDVLSGIGPEVQRIYCVDDHCPEETGKYVISACRDPRVSVLFHKDRQGVGGATLSGYAAALHDGCGILVKIDGDGQMDPGLISRFIRPIAAGEADYTKGNRFYKLEDLKEMPWLRLIGNAVLSFLAKLSTGYWNVFDPTNGFTAVHRRVLQLIPFEKIRRSYFFESDLLFRLNTVRAVVLDIPLEARYGEERSNLKIWRAIGEFAIKHMSNFMKRVFYSYFLRGFNIASLDLVVGLPLLAFGFVFGVTEWIRGALADRAATSGTVMLAALTFLLGVQLLFAFFNYDMQDIPRDPLHKRL